MVILRKGGGVRRTGGTKLMRQSQLQPTTKNWKMAYVNCPQLTKMYPKFSIWVFGYPADSRQWTWCRTTSWFENSPYTLITVSTSRYNRVKSLVYYLYCPKMSSVGWPSRRETPLTDFRQSRSILSDIRDMKLETSGINSAIRRLTYVCPVVSWEWGKGRVERGGRNQNVTHDHFSNPSDSILRRSSVSCKYIVHDAL